VLEIREDVGISIRQYYSPFLRGAAIRFLKDVGLIEGSFSSETIPENKIYEHRDHAIACLFFSVSYLEAVINELMLDILEDEPINGFPLIEGRLDVIRDVFSAGDELVLRKMSTLKKVDYLLKVFGIEPFNKGVSTYQNVDNLIRVRNAFIHYKPEWTVARPMNDGVDRREKLEKRLNGVFSTNPYCRDTDSYIPVRILSQSACNWALTSVDNYVLSFYKKMGDIEGKQFKHTVVAMVNYTS